MTTDSLRERIREILWRELEYDGEDFCGHIADVLIRELDDVLVDFGLWLSEEITGKPISRIDLESCLQEWKGCTDD